jgi:tRNA nucleotidyltransferase (CCA-adding enzyme)
MKNKLFSFWNSKPSKLVKTKSVKPKLFFQPKFIQPIKITPKIIKKNILKQKLTYPQAVKRYPRLSPFGDADRDGKLNMFDCYPFNRKKHTTISFKNKNIKVETPIEVKSIVNILNKKGKAYIVGGFVRDILLERHPKDVDIEVHGMTPDEISEQLQSEYNVNEVGKSFGVLKVSSKTGSRRDAIDVSVPRADSTGRKPTVEFLKKVTPKKAASRRDFTINAIMYDTKEDKIVDPFKGVIDLEQGKIKAVTNEAFSEDPLRVIRAAQFASRFDFDIEPKTAIEARKANMKDLSGERIQEELRKVSLKSKKPSKFFIAMDEMGQLDKVFPEISGLKNIQQNPEHHPEGDAFIHTMQVIDRIAESENKNHNMFLTGILHDTGKIKTTTINPKTGKIQAIGHQTESAKITKEFMERLHYPNKEKEDVMNLVEHHMDPHRLVINDSTKLKHKNRLLVKIAGGYNKLATNPEKAITRYQNTINFAKQDKGGDNILIDKYKELEKLPSSEKYKRIIKGDEVIAQGYTGLAIGKKLEELYKAQISKIKEDETQKENQLDVIEDIKDQKPSEDIIEDSIENDSTAIEENKEDMETPDDTSYEIPENSTDDTKDDKP